MQIDIGFGDVTVPTPKEIQYPAMLGARIRAYPPEAVVAEKLEALVRLGMANTRMKDSTISGSYRETSILKARW